MKILQSFENRQSGHLVSKSSCQRTGCQRTGSAKRSGCIMSRSLPTLSLGPALNPLGYSLHARIRISEVAHNNYSLAHHTHSRRFLLLLHAGFKLHSGD